MSGGHNKKRKAAKAKRTPYEAEIARRIRQGIYTRFHLVTTGDDRLERGPAPKNLRRRKKAGLTLRQQSTMAVLTKDQYADAQITTAPAEAAEDAV